jgi:hypothetical protein
MSFTLSGAITGGPQTDLTSPTYTATADTAPDLRSKQFAFLAIGGTQAGVYAHSVTAPFTCTFRRPSFLRTLGQAVVNGITGRYSKIPINDYVMIVRKAALIAAGQYVVNEYRATFRIYAGTETYDAPNVRAGFSLFVGAINTNSAGIGDASITGII